MSELNLVAENIVCEQSEIKKQSLKSINFLLNENEFQVIKVYTACSGVTIRDLISTVVKDWIKENRESIEHAIGKVGGRFN